MDLRKFLVFFAFTIIFLLSVSVYAGVGMTVKLPPPPDGVGNFVVGYMPRLGTYRLGSTSYDGDIYIGDGGTLVDSYGEKIYFGARYELVDGSWVQYTGASYWTAWYDDVNSVVSGQGKVIVFSSNNFYGTKGQLLAFAATDDVLTKGVTLIGNQISSSKILLYMFYPFRQIILYILIVIVLVIAFYKAWKFVKGAF